MNSNKTKLIATLALAISASGAWADSAEHQADELARFRRFAGAPVDEFNLVNIFQTQIVGDTEVVVWPTINTAYLLTVDSPCNNLAFAHGFVLTQEQAMRVSKRFDFVTFGGQRCRISEIRPVDYKAMLKADEAPG